MSMNLKNQMVVLVVSCVFGASSCRNTANAADATTKDAVSSAPAYSCLMSYSDTGIQEQPMFKESFRIELADRSSSAVKSFGVTPQGSYTAAVRPNMTGDQVEGVVLSITRAEDGLTAHSVSDLSTKTLMSILQLNAKQTFLISCNRDIK